MAFADVGQLTLPGRQTWRLGLRWCRECMAQCFHGATGRGRVVRDTAAICFKCVPLVGKRWGHAPARRALRVLRNGLRKARVRLGTRLLGPLSVAQVMQEPAPAAVKPVATPSDERYQLADESCAGDNDVSGLTQQALQAPRWVAPTVV